MLALAVRWILDQGPTVALWGARRPDQLDGIDAAFGWKLDADDLREIDALLAEHITDPVGPEFMAPPLRQIGVRGLKSSDSAAEPSPSREAATPGRSGLSRLQVHQATSLPQNIFSAAGERRTP